MWDGLECTVYQIGEEHQDCRIKMPGLGHEKRADNLFQDFLII